MKNKYICFAKNIGLSSVAGIASGAGAAEFSSLLTDNKTTIAVISTVSEYVAAYSVFLPLHARDNQDVYNDFNGNFKWKDFIKDQIKLAGGFVLLDIAYLIGRPFLTKEFLESGVNPSRASLYADGIFYSVFLAAAFPIAKITGNIKSKNSLEDSVK